MEALCYLWPYSKAVRKNVYPTIVAWLFLIELESTDTQPLSKGAFRNSVMCKTHELEAGRGRYNESFVNVSNRCAIKGKEIMCGIDENVGRCVH